MGQKIIFLKGLPASGKTSWAIEKCREDIDLIRLNKDDLRKEFGNPSWSREFEDKVVAAQRSRGISLLNLKHSLIIDDCNFSENHKKFWHELSIKLGIEFEEKYFNVDVEECIKRDKTRENSIGEAEIRRMYNTYVRPNSLHSDIRYMLEQDPTLPSCIICDLDGTLAIHNGRNPYDDSKIFTDKLNKNVKRILDTYDFIGYTIIYLSGRNESARMNTENWLRNNYCTYEKSKLLMRPDQDFRPDEIVKREIYERKIKDKFFVEFVLDDRDKVVRMWREIGLLCLQVYYGDF